MDQYIGKMLDNRYEILERIGTGGMAIVYKAKCHRLNRLVAIKILKSDLAQNEEFRRRFNAESQAVAQLSHPNIVSVYDVSRGGDMEYIVMELIDGITLKQYMEKRGQLNWRESLHFIIQIKNQNIDKQKKQYHTFPDAMFLWIHDTDTDSNTQNRHRQHHKPVVGFNLITTL